MCNTRVVGSCVCLSAAYIHLPPHTHITTNKNTQLEDAIAAAKAEIEALASARVQEAEEQALRSELRATAAERGVEAAEAAAAGAQV